VFDWTAEFSCSSIELRSYHAMHWSCIHGLAASAGIQLRATDTEISAALWALEAVEGLYFAYCIELLKSLVDDCICL